MCESKKVFGDYHEMAHIWAGIQAYLIRFLRFILFKPVAIVLCKGLTLSAASIFVTEGL